MHIIVCKMKNTGSLTLLKQYAVIRKNDEYLARSHYKLIKQKVVPESPVDGKTRYKKLISLGYQVSRDEVQSYMQPTIMSNPP
jgi:hypothetical protein